MYAVDDRDRVREIGNIPQCSIGAPIPIVLANEWRTCVASYVQDDSPWDGSSVRVVSPQSDEPWAIVVFVSCYAHMFGPPNDEAFSGHPLAARGLSPYNACLVEDSSWIRGLERMNSVHPGHDPALFLRGQRHFVLSFHDSVFECVAEGFAVIRGSGPLTDAVATMNALLHERSVPMEEVSLLPPRTSPDPPVPVPRPWWKIW